MSIYIYIYIHTYKDTYIHIYIHTHIHIYINAYMHIYKDTYIHTYFLDHDAVPRDVVQERAGAQEAGLGRVVQLLEHTEAHVL